MTKPPTMMENFLDYCGTVFEDKADLHLLQCVLGEFLQNYHDVFNFSREDMKDIADICNRKHGLNIKTDNFKHVKPMDFMTEHSVFMLKHDVNMSRIGLNK